MSRVPLHYNKIYTLEKAIIFCEGAKLLGRTVAFTNGCFDILHAGHIHSLQQAASFADYLFVGLNSDASTKRLKGEERPLNNEQDRATVLSALTCVDGVTIFEEDTPLNIIKALMPSVLVKGGDYTEETIVGAKEVKAFGGVVKIIELIPGLSTTALSQKLKML
jgi:D-glycero-beta-D-manno-heptose 1-phosphate adenylyltransferase